MLNLPGVKAVEFGGFDLFRIIDLIIKDPQAKSAGAFGEPGQVFLEYFYVSSRIGRTIDCLDQFPKGAEVPVPRICFHWLRLLAFGLPSFLEITIDG